jgi:hypothetical protein
VLGAFKATPIRQLETEAYVPPLDLWLNGRIACFLAQLKWIGIARQIKDACAAIRRQWVGKWIGQPIEQWDEREKPKVLADWTNRWKAGLRRLEQAAWPGTDPGSRAIPEDTPPNKAVLKLYLGLQKAENSVLVQARTGRIRLAKVLYNRKVPGIQSAQCRCGAGEETPRYMALYCIEEAGRRLGLRTNGRVNYQHLIGTASGAKLLAKWPICSGRLGQFSLARSLLYN